MTVAPPTSSHAVEPVELVVRTTPLPDPGPLLDLLPDAELACWVRGGEGLVGWGVAARVEVSGPDRFAAADRWWHQLVARAQVRDGVQAPGSGLVAFGAFAFDGASPAGSALVVPAVLVGHRAGRWWVTSAGLAGREPPAPDLGPIRSLRSAAAGRIEYRDGALSAGQWQAAVATAVERLAAGGLHKVVLAREVRAQADRPVQVRHLLGRLAARYPSTWTFALEGLVGATPELLVRLAGGSVSSRALAGTVRRLGGADQDRAAAFALANSGKDLAEHGYAVRSVADALRPWCTSLTVPAAPFVLRLPNVLHLATEITGVLGQPVTSLGLAGALHPSAAVCGTPTGAARALIAELEGMDRGRYSGPVGWLNATGDGEWGVALRCAQLDRTDPTRLRLYSGCGIVAGSNPSAELAESMAKLLPMQEALAEPN